MRGHSVHFAVIIHLNATLLYIVLTLLNFLIFALFNSIFFDTQGKGPMKYLGLQLSGFFPQNCSYKFSDFLGEFYDF